MKTLRILTLTALLVGLAAAAASARPGPRGDAPRGDGFGPGRDGGPRWERLLDLTDEQKASLEALRESHRSEAVAQRKELAKLRHEIEGLMMEDEPDAGRLEKLIRKAGDLKTEMRVQGVKHRLEMRELLTAEQRDRLLLMKARGGEGRRAPRAGGPDGCGPAPACDGHGRGRGEGRGR